MSRIWRDSRLSGDARHDLGDLAQLLESSLVRRVSGYDVATQHVRRPAAELHASRGLHAIADGEDHVEVVVLRLVRLAVAGSCRKFCDNSILGPCKLLTQRVGNVLVDGLDVASKEGRELRGSARRPLAPGRASPAARPTHPWTQTGRCSSPCPYVPPFSRSFGRTNVRFGPDNNY